MRILFVNKLYPPDYGGGVEIMLPTLATGLQALGHEVCVVTTTRTRTRMEEQVSGVPVVRLPLFNLYWHNRAERPRAPLPILWHAFDMYNVPMAWALLQEIRRFSPDVVSYHNLAGFSVSAWSAGARYGRPSVQIINDYYHLCARSQMYRSGHNCEKRCASCTFLRLGRRRASRHLKAVVGVGKTVLDAHLEQGYFEGVPIRKVIYATTVNATRIAENKHQSCALRAKRFGFIGTLGEWKGIRRLLEAFERVRREHPSLELKLLVGGDGDPMYVSELRQRFGCAAVSFLGRVDAATFYQQIDALIVPSLWREPLGMVAAESLLAGVPVVAAALGGIPEIVVDGVNGLLFDPHRPNELEACLSRLSTEDGFLAQLGARSVASAAPYSDVQRMIDDYRDLYAAVTEMD